MISEKVPGATDADCQGIGMRLQELYFGTEDESVKALIRIIASFQRELRKHVDPPVSAKQLLWAAKQ